MVRVKTEYFSLRKIMESGQIFRMYEPEEGLFVVFSGDRRLEIKQENESEVCFLCEKTEFEGYWEEYFDLKRDYAAIVKKAKEINAGKHDRGSSFLAKACEFGSGIRILRQDIWEMMLSFIISQQKQIPSIRKCIEALCARFGTKHEEEVSDTIKNENTVADKTVWYGFPTAQAIVSSGPEGLKGLSLGYRERYIYETALKYLTEGIKDEEIIGMPYEKAKAFFCSYTGIGEKVADCICLFGAGFRDAFPIDVHIKEILYREFVSDDRKSVIEEAVRKKTGGKELTVRKIIDSISYAEYMKIIEENFTGFEGVKGIVQQWIFAYELKAH